MKLKIKLPKMDKGKWNAIGLMGLGISIAGLIVNALFVIGLTIATVALYKRIDYLQDEAKKAKKE